MARAVASASVSSDSIKGLAQSIAKPAYRLGIAEIQVGWKERELAVRVEPEQDVYRVRETAAVRIGVHTPDGAEPPAGEVADSILDVLQSRS